MTTSDDFDGRFIAVCGIFAGSLLQANPQDLVAITIEVLTQTEAQAFKSLCGTHRHEKLRQCKNALPIGNDAGNPVDHFEAELFV